MHLQQSLLEFLSLTDPNIRSVVVGIFLLTSSAAMIGTFALLQQRVLVGDAIAHAVLPGICLSFLLTGTKHPIYLIVGAFITGWLSLVLIDQITHRSKIKEDTALALVLSVTFGLGILLLTAIQHTGNASQVGLSHFLFGKAAALVSEDVWTLGLLSLLLIVMVGIFFKEFTLIAFDKAFAQASGLPVRHLELLLTSLTVLAIVVGIRVVGTLLMAAILITPPAAARFWTHHLPTLVCLAALLGMLAGWIGAFVSYIAPSMPTGPWIVLALTLLAYGSFLFAPRRGLLARSLQQRRHRQKTLSENILKVFCSLGELDGHYYKRRTAATLCRHRPMPLKTLLRGLRTLQKKNMVQCVNSQWFLTATGKHKGQEVARLHTLWQLYLTRYLKIKPDHVYEDAESIEHILTPALAQELQRLVDSAPPPAE